MTEQIGLKHLIIGIILVIILTLTPPVIAWKFLDKFTYNFAEALEEQEQRLDQEKFERVKEYCDFDVVGTRYGYECRRPCMKHSLDDKNCVRKGCVDSGFLNLGMDCDWYVCEGFGDIQSQCLSYYRGSKEDYCKEYPDDEMYCYRYTEFQP